MADHGEDDKLGLEGIRSGYLRFDAVRDEEVQEGTKQFLRRCAVSGKSMIWIVGVACLCGWSWLIGQQSPVRSAKPESKVSSYSLSKSGSSDLLLESVQGKTWMLRRLGNGDPAWLPIPRIDSDKEAAAAWRKSTNFNLEAPRVESELPLDKALKERGFVAITLDRLRAGYLAIDVRIDGKKLSLMLDTGAPVTHLDMERTKPLQLKWQLFNPEGGKEKPQVGTDSCCEITKLEIGGLTVDRLMVGGHDSSEINKVLKAYLDPPIDGQLGSDVLTKLNAVIDYSTLKLYLRSPEKRD